MQWSPSLTSFLDRNFGFSSFRGEQASVITSVLKRFDTVALLPTGGGKSLCYQFPVRYAHIKALVISPLISLMEDQIRHLSMGNYPAFCIHSGKSKDHNNRAWRSFADASYGLLYVSPEKALSKRMLSKFESIDIRLLVVDEAHCISQWGHDFRPAYLDLHTLCSQLNNPAILALTATATSQVLADIVHYLGMKNPTIFRQSFVRENIQIRVDYHNDPKNHLLKVLAYFPHQPSIVYLRSRKDTEVIAEFLRNQGFLAKAYHGGMDNNLRNKAMQEWIAEQAFIMVATNAFGMGIDKKNVRLVVHLDIPPSMEEYYQEIGRAGRDGLDSKAVMILAHAAVISSKSKAQRFIVSEEELSNVITYLNKSMVDYGIPFEYSMASAKKELKIHPLKIVNCLKLMERYGYITASEAIYNPSTVIVHRKAVKKIVLDRYPKPAYKLLDFMLKKYEDLFDKAVVIDEVEIARELSVLQSDVVDYLRDLMEENLLHYEAKEGNEEVKIWSALSPDVEKLLAWQKHQYGLLQEMLSYVRSDACRQKIILDYFGEDSLSCQHCDNCEALQISDDEGSFNRYVMNLINKGIPIKVGEILENHYLNRTDSIHHLQLLIQEKKVKIQDGRIEGIK